MQTIIQYDQQLLIYLNQLGNSSWDTLWKAISYKLTWIPLYITLLYYLFKKYPIKQFVLILIVIILGITLSDQLCNFFKLSVMRLRPCNDPNIKNLLRLVGSGGTYGFYSAHSSNSFFVATIASFLYSPQKKVAYFLYFWAIVVAYSRIYLAVHYPMDIMMGALMGFLIGGLMYQVFLWASVRYINQ